MPKVLDFETKESLDINTYGAGWAFGTCKSLCCSVVDPDTMEAKVFTGEDNWTGLFEELNNTPDLTLIAHNGVYDFGVLLSLGFDIYRFTCIDTMYLVYFYNNTLSLSLNNCMKFFFNEVKSDLPLAMYALRHRLCSPPGFATRQERVLKRSIMRRKFYSKPAEKRFSRKRTGEVIPQYPPKLLPQRTTEERNKILAAATKWVKCNMDIMYERCPELVKKYCIDDSIGTAKLYNRLKDTSSKDLQIIFSYALKCVIRSRKAGIRIDNKKLQKARDILFSKEEQRKSSIYHIIGRDDFNINSSEQLGVVLEELGYKLIKNTKTGNYNITGDWLEEMYTKTKDHLFSLILEYRKYSKARNDFCDKFIDLLKVLNRWDQPYGRIHPSLNIFGARDTGRLSCSSPNMQQMPSIDKNEEIGLLIRSFFVPEEGEEWVSADWMAQEPRIGVHFGVAYGLSSAVELAAAWKENPVMDIHMHVAKVLYPEIEDPSKLKEERGNAKRINLAISYGEGKKKLFYVELKTDWENGERILSKYLSKFPYLKQQSEIYISQFGSPGFITTLLGRKVHCPQPVFIPERKAYTTYNYKATNYKMQGSGADMCYLAMAQWEMAVGIPMLFPVHDEINISTKSVDKVKILKYIMENGMKLHVPLIVEIGKGSSWADACENVIEV